MRYIRMIFIFLAGLAICGLIAVSLAMELRGPQGPDLGIPDYEQTGDMPSSEDVRLWYSASILGRWSEDGRCEGPDETWIFARHRVIRPQAVCEISRFVSAEVPALDLLRCEAIDIDEGMEETDERMDARLVLNLRSEADLTVMGPDSVDLVRCP